MDIGDYKGDSIKLKCWWMKTVKKSPEYSKRCQNKSHDGTLLHFVCLLDWKCVIALIKVHTN